MIFKHRNHSWSLRLNFEDFEVDQARREGGGANCPGPPIWEKEK
jgi:hypothetical protein